MKRGRLCLVDFVLVFLLFHIVCDPRMASLLILIISPLVVFLLQPKCFVNLLKPCSCGIPLELTSIVMSVTEYPFLLILVTRAHAFFLLSVSCLLHDGIKRIVSSSMVTDLHSSSHIIISGRRSVCACVC